MDHHEPEYAMTVSTPSASVKPAAKPAPGAPQRRPAPKPPVSAVNETERHSALIRVVTIQSILIAVLSVVLVFCLPFSQPIYQYYALNPKQQVMQLVPLTVPNMTNQAVLSWATTSVTEIMTMGFGDYKEKLLGQKPRFTTEGWEAFSTAFDKQEIGKKFKEHQLVLTTVPSDTPVIVAQGVNPKRLYEWRVQMPVIMTYATNDNKTEPKRVVFELTIVRVPATQNPSGIGISNWSYKT